MYGDICRVTKNVYWYVKKLPPPHQKRKFDNIKLCNLYGMTQDVSEYHSLIGIQLVTLNDLELHNVCSANVRYLCGS